MSEVPRWLRICKAAASLGLLFLLSLLSWQAIELVRDVRAGLSGTLSQTDAILQRLGSASDEWARASVKAREVSEDQRQALRESSQRLNRILAEAEAVLTEVRGAVGDARLLVRTVETRSDELGRAAVPVLEQARADLEATERILAQLDLLASDPAIPATMQAVRRSAEHTDEILVESKAVVSRTDELLAELQRVAKTGRRLLLVQIFAAIASGIGAIW